MAYQLTKEVFAALLIRGLHPLLDEAEMADDDDILRFAGTETYLAVCQAEISLNERMSIGGNVQDCSWQLNADDIPTFAARVVHVIWEACGAEIASASRANRK